LPALRPIVISFLYNEMTSTSPGESWHNSCIPLVAAFQKGVCKMEYESGLERRHLQRFSVRAFAVVQTVSPGAEKVFELRTQDISSEGAFFPMQVPLPAGERVRVTLLLSISAIEQLHDMPKAAKIITEGEVIRSTEQGVAVKFAEQYTMSPAEGVGTSA